MENRIIQAKIRKIDDDSRTIEFIASDNSRDAHKTVIPVDKWDLSRFNKNGVIGYQHSLQWSSDPDDVIGVGVARIEDEKLIVSVKFEPEDINPKAEKIYKKVKFGSLKAISVGFNPTKKGYFGEGDQAQGEKNETYYFDGQELLETSVVNIPSNKNALKRSLELMMNGMSDIEKEEEVNKPEEENKGKDKGKKAGKKRAIEYEILTIANAILAQN